MMRHVLHRDQITAFGALSLILAACDNTSQSTDIDPVAAQTQQVEGREQEPSSLVAPHRYLRLIDLAAAIRQAGHSCEKVTAYTSVEEDGQATGVYKIDCLEYSYRLTIINGRGRIERWRG